MRRASFAVAIWVACSSPATGQATAEEAGPFRLLETLGRCRPSPADEVVVCGTRRNQDRYRLPDLGDRASAGGAAHLRGEAPRASTEVTASGACGIFEGQRRCGKAEMAEAGYGEGRDPISFLGALVARLADPDAD